jgi:ketosteroid isomerase-like protein
MMNPFVMIGITMIIAAEKMLPKPEIVAQVVGLATIIAGIASSRKTSNNHERSKRKTPAKRVVVLALKRAHEIIRQILAPDVRWEVVPGFPHSDVYLGLNGVFDFFTSLFKDFEDWHTEPSEFFETGDRVIAIGTYSARAKATGPKSAFAHRLDAARRISRLQQWPTPSKSRKLWAKTSALSRHERHKPSHRRHRWQSRHRL